MQQELIKIKEMLDFKNLKLINISIITRDKMQNKFLCIKKDGISCLEVAYYNYGITYSYAIDKKGICYIQPQEKILFVLI